MGTFKHFMCVQCTRATHTRVIHISQVHTHIHTQLYIHIHIHTHLHTSYDYGIPVDPICHETAPSSGVFTRRWTKATVTLDCNTFTPNITLDGHSAPIPVPPLPPPPTPAPPAPCPPALNATGYSCTTHTCGADLHHVNEHCGDDLCYPTVKVASLCEPLPSPLGAAVAEAKRRCDEYAPCMNFAIDTDKTKCGWIDEP